MGKSRLPNGMINQIILIIPVSYTNGDGGKHGYNLRYLEKSKNCNFLIKIMCTLYPFFDDCLKANANSQ